MTMNRATASWLYAWKIILMIILGIPTLGYVWLYLIERFGERGSSLPDKWQYSAVVALESWLHIWRGIGFFIAGFLTFGYAWFAAGDLEEPIFLGLREKYRRESKTDGR